MISIVVYSSDFYKDCWDPFFNLFEKNFPIELDCELILVTNTFDYSHQNLNINTITTGLDIAWSKRLKIGLDSAKHELIFLIGDDFFLLKKLDLNFLNYFIDLMNNSSDIDHIRLLLNPGKFKVIDSDYDNLDMITQFTKYRFLYAPSLWKKDSLLEYIVDFETPFMSEKMGTYRAWILKHNFYCLSDNFLSEHGQFYECGTSGVIAKGKWEKWAVPILEKENLGIDFSIRGVKLDYGSKKSIWKARRQQLLQPASTMKSIFSIVKLLIYSRLNQHKKTSTRI